MLRFIHAADPHLDSPLKGLAGREGVPVEVLRGATRRAFENLVALALEQRVAFVLIAGDLYDGDWKDYSTGLFFVRQMERLRVAGIRVYLIAGNHDAASVISRRLTLPENVQLFSSKKAESYELPGLPVVVHGRSFPQRAVPENLALDYPSAVPGRCNIGLLHTSLTGRPGHDPYAPCTLEDLRAKGYQYWALGHIHQPEILSQEPWIVFPGNLQGRHANECGPRGCQLVTIDDDHSIAAVEWHALDVVRWARLTVTAPREESAGEEALLERVGEAMAQAVSEAEGRLLALRVTLTGATPLHGQLHQQRDRWYAELQGRAAACGEGAVWIERLRIETQPVYDLEALAERDALTGIVLESLAAAAQAESVASDAAEAESPGEKPKADEPAQLRELLALLPTSASDIRAELEAELAPGNRPALLQEVRSIILEALGTSVGGRA